MTGVLFAIVLSLCAVAQGAKTTPPDLNKDGIDWWQVRSGDPNNYLWRFQTGPAPQSGSGLTIGEDYMCFIGGHFQKFIRPDGNKDMVSGSTNCQAEERYQLEWRGDLMYLLMYDGRTFVDCSPDNVVRDWHTCCKSGQGFYVYTDEDDTHIWLKNDRGGGTLYSNDGSSPYFNCNGAQTYYGSWDPAGTLIGWKAGDEDSWEPYDAYAVIATLDNCDNPNEGTLAYAQTIGTEISETSSWTTSTDMTISVGGGIEGIVTGEMSTSIGYDWGSEESEVFQEAQTITVTSQVGPYQKVVMQQAVSYVGPATVYSTYFKPVGVACETGAKYEISTKSNVAFESKYVDVPNEDGKRARLRKAGKRIAERARGHEPKSCTA
ncbi:hypothetical protein BSKO_09345 [Bryopsis sp. KO-2023]|nr:hypothetical protein BSKO_09345 [Bryopsis sp. KO-2023]